MKSYRPPLFISGYDGVRGPDLTTAQRGAAHRVRCRERLRGLLRFYTRAA